MKRTDAAPRTGIHAPAKTAEQRFWEKTRSTEKIFAGTPCIEWTAALRNDGYGEFWHSGRMVRAHRWAYQWQHGTDSIPDGLHLDHLCRNRACVNPDHLEPVTPQENIRRGEAGTPQRSRTHCPQGHEYTTQNTTDLPDGSRRCRTCARDQQRGRYVPRGVPRSERTHCPQGHPYDEANTYVTPAGHRQCRACRKQRDSSRSRRGKS